ncbi:cadherin-like domain-containing protein, partial [Mesorhizobium sp. M7D.F.Ca.US.004.01.2.1]|uniref:Ig-like domain-containing protein n=1 Tax=Mesorhizobium sp. M7D.F.Ca.US.004.01.2.1 TaxID=2496738 RepID=UPI0013DECAC8
PNPAATGAADQATGENFAVKVTDSDNDTANASLTVKVNDDGPHAVNDGQTQATENAPVTIDVFANDVHGADGVLASTVTLVAGSLSGSGILVNNGNGTFTYTPGAGEQVPVSFSYTIKDGDGDTSQATATITLVADSIPTVTVTPTGGTPAVDATAVVDEKGLADGSG